jgi:hypothetical protein
MLKIWNMRTRITAMLFLRLIDGREDGATARSGKEWEEKWKEGKALPPARLGLYPVFAG